MPANRREALRRPRPRRSLPEQDSFPADVVQDFSPALHAGLKTCATPTRRMHESVTARASRRRKNGRLLSAQPKRVRGIQLVTFGRDVHRAAAVTYNPRAIAATITG